jgi:hypothetical protein
MFYFTWWWLILAETYCEQFYVTKFYEVLDFISFNCGNTLDERRKNETEYDYNDWEM